MSNYEKMTQEELRALKAELDQQYAGFKAKHLALNMARGKPDTDQLDLSMPMLSLVLTSEDCISENGIDCRNYGELAGLPEAKRLMGTMLDEELHDNVIVGGNSSLNLMYDQLQRLIQFGTLDGEPWSKLDKVKWLCPVPGYDRHFRITENFGFEMIPIPMDENGPDMDLVESLVANDETIKGMWSIPKYSNPSGITYSDEVVRRLASMECAAKDFRIFWDNAYCVHHLYDDVANQDQLLDIGKACREAGNPNRYYKFGSTSKVTLPGAGISAVAASPETIAEIKGDMGVGIISYDKMNQLRHVKFLKDAEGIAEHMSKHAVYLRPKFELVAKKLAEGLAPEGLGKWTDPRGGYFVTFNAPNGCAKRIVELAQKAGVTMTDAGSTWPYHKDPNDSDIRIAPTLPPLAELDAAMDVFVCCVKMAAIEQLLD